MRALPRAAAVAAVAMAVCSLALAQDYPTRTITLVVPYPPGGGVDAMARVVAEKLAGALGQQVVVDNRAGGSGLVGTRAFIKSPPDGYTLFLGHTGSISINPSLYANAGFDPRKDFAPIGLIASMPVALLAHPSFPAKTIGDVVAVAKTAGANFNIGTSAVGTGGYLTAELFKSVTGIDAAIIPYKSVAGLHGAAYAFVGLGLSACRIEQSLHWLSYALIAIYTHSRDSPGTTLGGWHGA